MSTKYIPQPYDADLAAIAALTTTSFGRSLLTQSDSSQVRTLLGLATTDSPTFAGIVLPQVASIGNLPTNGISFISNAATDIVLSGFPRARFSGGALTITGTLGFTSFNPASPDLVLQRDAANTLHQRNGTAGQIARWAKTWTSLTNNELFEIDCAGNAATFDLAVCSGSAGGTNRGLRFGSKFAGGAFSPWLSFDTAGRIGVNQNADSAFRFAVTQDNTQSALFTNNASSSSAGGAGILGIHNDGAGLANGDRLGFYLLGGSSGPGTVNNSAGIQAFATENWSGTAAGARLDVVVQPNGTVGTGNRITAASFASNRITFNSIVDFPSEPTQTPTGTTATITLDSGNHQTLTLGSASGAVTVTLTVPTSSSAGTIIVTQGATVRDLTWAVSSGTIQWMGGEPDWAADAISTSRMVAWRWNGSVMRLAATEVNS